MGRRPNGCSRAWQSCKNSRSKANSRINCAVGNCLHRSDQLLAVCQKAPRAIADLDFALRRPPAQAAALLTVRATALAWRGQPVPAAEAADKLLALDSKNCRNAYNAACIYALCVSSVGRGKSPEQLTPEEADAKNALRHPRHRHPPGCRQTRLPRFGKYRNRLGSCIDPAG